MTVVDTGTAAGAQALVVLAAAEAAAGAATCRRWSRPPSGWPAGSASSPPSPTSSGSPARAGSRTPPAGSATVSACDRCSSSATDAPGPLRPAFSPEVARERIVRAVHRRRAGGRPEGRGRLHAIVLHALDAPAAADLRARVERLEPTTCLVGPFSPVMVAHTGDGLAGLAWWWER